jgi:hypothetical protein
VLSRSSRFFRMMFCASKRKIFHPSAKLRESSNQLSPSWQTRDNLLVPAYVMRHITPNSPQHILRA